mgnify:CR=1 FL=1
MVENDCKKSSANKHDTTANGARCYCERGTMLLRKGKHATAKQSELQLRNDRYFDRKNGKHSACETVKIAFTEERKPPLPNGKNCRRKIENFVTGNILQVTST